MSEQPRKDRSALYLALVYVGFSSLWIFGSDWLAERFAGGNFGLLQRIQHLKGVFFVCCSGLLIYLLSRGFTRSLRAALLRKRELLQKYYTLNELTKEAVYDYNFATNEAWVNGHLRTLLGASSNQVSGFFEKHRACIHDEDRERVLAQFDSFLQSRDNYWQTTYRYRPAGSASRDMICRGYLLRDPSTGAAANLICALQDITDIRAAEAAHYQQQLRHRQELASLMMTAQEAERDRWAQELHDNVCQLLTVAQLQLQNSGGAEAPLVERAAGSVRKALDEIRHLSATLKPPAFGSETLHQAIADLAANIQRVRPCRFLLQLPPDLEDALSNEQKLTLYRVVQEQLSNIIKYAGASEVQIRLEHQAGQLLLSVSDNGKGFDATAVTGGIGLKNIQGRLQVFSGGMRLHTRPGAGCTLEAWFPLS